MGLKPESDLRHRQKEKARGLLSLFHASLPCLAFVLVLQKCGEGELEEKEGDLG